MTIATNPFSLLDVQIPSPTLAIPFAPQVAAVQQSSDDHHDVYGIGLSTSIGLPTPPPEAVIHKHLQRDE